ncbi:hypothetical protein BU24DRAFT_416334 [Aaosphaeria arxii CBS 175.79]|uniref:Uncharacterized protein n=1 Tax=Aaosphaeria arxii CBS 175.79 TaxID=1450172 RepID=A0A6A5Y5T6_9PLEO|nr:uncharacterized protein BU24DRAFT_416334 [Aaosphaeria arxii CBS 175.79]KAF2020656.1 hypothetical protein BU24DRAFT_416334 [Aaosphaeria arxii CBS 175.79]
MAPVDDLRVLSKRFPVPSTRTSPPTRSSLTTEGGFLEAWAQGYNVGSLVILILIVFCNYRSGIWLHKLILLELILALWHGTFIFVEDPVYGWYLSATATLLFISYQLHNVVSWLKIRPFLPKWGSRLFILSLLAVQPFWVAEAWSNFSYFNGLGSNVNERMRPWEALLRDPWWIFTTWKLLDAIKKTYGFKLLALVKINPRFGVMIACMFISIAFLLTDVVVNAIRLTSSSGINPYWRFALVFKCASDTIFLDDFKSVLDEIVARKFSSTGGTIHRGPQSRRKSSVTARDPNEFIECGPITTHISSPEQANTAWSRHLNPFVSRSRDHAFPVPSIHVQQETRVISERKPSSDSYASDNQILPVPAPAVYASKQDNSSTSSLSIARPQYPER